MEWLTRGSSFYSSMTKGLGSQCRVRLAPQNIEISSAYPNDQLEYICESHGSLYWSQLTYIC